MRLHVDFSSLEEAVRRMGATVPTGLVIDVRRGVDPVAQIDITLPGGIELDLSDITRGLDGLLSYKGRQVVLYIQDQGWNIGDVLADGRNGRKVHVADCETLRQMQRENRFERYVATNNVSGDFHVTGQDAYGGQVEGEARLRVCKNCLRMLDYRSYRGNPSRVFQAFEWSEFFDTYRASFTQMPKRQAGDPEGYPSNWDRISSAYKEAQHFMCESCRVDLREHPGLLHVHHIDGVKIHNAQSNLKALCVDCHSRQPRHSHMRVSSADANLLASLRRQQNPHA